ncbi:hypothetical protein A0130_13240 [Leifsonia xyli]|uniref:ATP-binding protein n=1 Tax=Leifsonia xyli TaxID=1575 RepID=UPI0007CDB3A7|nr:hypothetical protein A0130_13240 [Leifsonia xyli]
MGKLYGRSEELSLLDDLVNRLPEAGGALVIHGEAGIGKTALGEHAARRAAARGCAVSSVTATESEASVPYSALQALLHPFEVNIRAMRFRPRTVLEAAFGILDGAAPDLFAVATAVLELLGDAAAETGLLVFLDDAQWVDGSTARVLGFVARRIAADPVAIVLALRDGYRSPLLDSDVNSLSVEALTPEDSEELLREQRPELAPRARRQVSDLASGNPLALLELPPNLAGDDTSTLNRTVHRAFLDRFKDASPETRRLLLIAAVNDGDSLVEVREAATTTGMAEDIVNAALDEAEARRTVGVDGDHYRFRHPLVRSAITTAATPDERRQAHAALADALREDRDRSVWHRAASVRGTDAGSAADLEAAADRALAQGNLAVAYRALDLSATRTPDPDHRARRRLRAAQVAVELGRPDVASDVITQIHVDSLTSSDATRLALLEASVQPRAQTPAELRSLIQRGRDAVNRGDLELAIDVSLVVSENVDHAGYTAASDLADLIAAHMNGDDPRRLAVLAAADPGRYLPQVSEALTTIDPLRMTRGAELLIRVRSNVDADPALAHLQRRLLEFYRSRGQLRSIAFLQPVHTWIEITLANWPEAARSAEEGSRLASEIGLPRWATGTLIGEAFVAAIRGDRLRADHLIRESEDGATIAGASGVLTGVQLTKGVNHLAQGRYEDAYIAFRRPFDPSDPSHHPVQTPWMIGDLLECASHTGRVEEVRALLPGLSPASSPWRTMAESYARPFLADGDVATEDEFQTALRGVVAGWPTYRTRLTLEYGSWLRRRQRIAEARDHLRIARELADSYAMHPLSERARGELRASGVESPAIRNRPWETLSAQELQVARLAAEGLSNREIGERLFLSHRTVSAHLYRIFPKLGVTSRSQLAAAIDQDG